MKILLWRNHIGDPLSYLIEAESRGQYTHAAMLLHDASLVIAEAYWPKLHTRTLIEAELAGLDVFEILGITPEIEGKCLDWWVAKINQGASYSIIDLLRFLAPVRAIIGDPTHSDAEKSMFCSMAVAQCLHDCGLNVLNAPSWEIDPVRLSESPLLKKLGDGTILKF